MSKLLDSIGDKSKLEFLIPSKNDLGSSYETITIGKTKVIIRKYQMEDLTAKFGMKEAMESLMEEAVRNAVNPKESVLPPNDVK